ncbi:rhomboid family intramembrane serine protease [Halovulum dunhuangense]|uniref:Rhomboid family intramembrane serine protease n=1 Tax=Halovulum dunhuangense TaxID=1505036 RepID=A0A849KV31_9RHOB|nr:rhomboid family intramembrane serine protease [Halovulum dunhuangense]NNU78895.1 rhomboid family intramembrane serine protease [Halovulum dunhuangense]
MRMYDPDHNASPVNPIPPVVMALVALVVAVELLFQAGARGLVGGPEAVGWRLEALRNFGFFSRYFDYMVQSGDWRIDGLWRFVTYSFIHYNLTHTLFAAVLLLALGNFTARLFHPAAILLAYAVSAVSGALVHALVIDSEAPLFGAYPAVYGLLGLYTWALWAAADKLGTNPYAAFRLIGVLVGIQVIFILIDGTWASLWSEIAGFVAGFLIATPLAPGGLRRLRRKLQGG